MPVPAPPALRSTRPVTGRGARFNSSVRATCSAPPPVRARDPVLDQPVIAQEDSGGSWTPPAPTPPTAQQAQHRRAMRARATSSRNSWMEEDPEVQADVSTTAPSAGLVAHAPQLAAGGRRQGLADFAPGLPSCCPSTPTSIIRNNGLYGIKGDYRCDIMKRSAVANTGFVEPLGARNEFLRYASYDMPNHRNQYMIKKGPSPGPHN